MRREHPARRPAAPPLTGPGALRTAVAAAVALLLCLLAAPAAQPASAAVGQPAHQGGARVGTWSAAMTGVPASDDAAFEDQTLRQVVHTSVGGEAPTVRLSNAFGEAALVVGEARVALRDEDAPGEARIEPGTDRQLTFGGRGSVSVPAGATAVSDPAALRVPAGADLVVSLYLPRHTPASTVHATALQTNAVADGNVTARPVVEATETPKRWYFLSGVSVLPRAPGRAAAVVTLGDSITDGSGSLADANHRWPDVLSQRLRAGHGTAGLGVLNQGLSGNRLLHDANPPEGSGAEDYAAYFGPSALARFDRDVLSQPGVAYLVVLIGVNDLGHPGSTAPESERVTAEDLIAGYGQLVARAHEHGIEVFGGTVTPFAGDTLGFGTPENLAARRQVNAWIREGGAFDGVIDFDAAVRDPAEPERLLPAYDGGDHLHPSDAGLAAMARAVPLSLFR